MPGPTDLAALRWLGNICRLQFSHFSLIQRKRAFEMRPCRHHVIDARNKLAATGRRYEGCGVTFVPDHPSLKAASCANNSPNPSMRPLTKGNIKFIAAPRNIPHIVGGLYNIIGDRDDEGGEGDNSFSAW